MAPANEMLDPHSGATPEGFKLAIMLDSQTWAYQLDPDKFGTGVAASKLQRANTELWRWIALIGLAVLLFEWWWYHKRTS